MNASIIWKPRRADFYKRLIMDIKEILGKCDHTLLAPDATFEQIKELIDEGIFFGVASCCIPPRYVSRAAEYAAGRVKICTVIGFPNGYNTLRVKVFETWNAVLNGADEIDMVINIGELKSGNYDYILKEVTEIKKACYGRPLKVIIETCFLTDEEKIKMCEIVTAAGADYIKTSTGFSHGGATVADVELLKAHVGENVKVKAAGGIKTLEDAEKLIEAGASRLGTSKIVRLAKEQLGGE